MVNDYFSHLTEAERKILKEKGTEPPLGLVDKQNKKIEVLSKGYKQRVGLAARLRPTNIT